ncbi:hypothetical protein DRN73_08225 [Candidatus Pacearchaeota archaeon]|nr:MAG: hypothetical protein DRN73_08225 [Candidatus Pacearchaeota archaeon]
MKLLIIGDTHIDEQSINELNQILQKDILKLDADECIQLGDFFDSSNPTPKELEFGSYFAFELKKRYKNVTILAGTGRHSSFGGVSITEYLKYIGIKPVGIEYELNRDNKKLLFGHWMTNKSLYEYGSYKHTVTELKQKYDIVVLGHLHLKQDIIKNRLFHLGSVNWKGWNEVIDTYKRLAIIDNGKVKFIKIKNAIPMKDVNSSQELEKQPKGIKIRLIINNIQQYLDYSEHFSKWKKDYIFTYILRTLDEAKVEETSNLITTQKEFAKNWLKRIKEKEIKNLLIKVFEKENLI